MYDELNGIGILTDSCSPVNRDFLLLTHELKSGKMSNGGKDSNPVRGEMFIEMGTTKHTSSSVGVTREIAARNTYRTYGAWWICALSYAINISPLTGFET